MFYKHTQDGYKPVLECIYLKTLVHGERTLFTEFKMEKGRQLPSHAHPQKQTGYLVSGHIGLTIGTDTFDVEPGDS